MSPEQSPFAAPPTGPRIEPTGLPEVPTEFEQPQPDSTLDVQAVSTVDMVDTGQGEQSTTEGPETAADDYRFRRAKIADRGAAWLAKYAEKRENKLSMRERAKKVTNRVLGATKNRFSQTKERVVLTKDRAIEKGKAAAQRSKERAKNTLEKTGNVAKHVGAVALNTVVTKPFEAVMVPTFNAMDAAAVKTLNAPKEVRAKYNDARANISGRRQRRLEDRAEYLRQKAQNAGNNANVRAGNATRTRDSKHKPSPLQA